MRRIFITAIFLAILCYLYSAQVGKINFPVGEVYYQANINQPYKPVSINMALSDTGYLKTGLGSSVEVLWNNGTTSTVPANRVVSIKNLMNEANTRRSEAQVQDKGLLYWHAEPLQDIDECIELFNSRQFARAIPLFNKVIEQSPLMKDAELAHAYLLIIYEELGDLQMLKKHIDTLKQDFPSSSLIESLPKD